MTICFFSATGNSLYVARRIGGKARTGRNPHTGEEIEIPAKKTIKAKLADKLLD